jgi:hypothetical protein
MVLEEEEGMGDYMIDVDRWLEKNGRIALSR